MKGMKKLLVASDSFKGTLSSKEIVSICKKVISESFSSSWSLDCQLIADGGEGTLDAFASLKKWKRIPVETFDAELSPIEAPILVDGEGNAVIEVASVIGLPLIKNVLDPVHRTTKGLGILVEKAVELGAKKIYVGLGGSSTNDLGMGMLRELGVRFNPIENPDMSNALGIKEIDLSRFLLKGKGIEFVCLSDVKNPLLGENGATYVYGPQKGYGKMLGDLEKKAARLSSLYEKAASKSLQGVPGLGAAGGLGAAFYAFMGATMKSGIEEILSLSHFKERAASADLVITGEGSFDEQSFQGKVYSGISKCVDPNKLIVLCGRSEIKNPKIKIYETSKEGASFEWIKQHAKEGYQETLRSILKEHE